MFNVSKLGEYLGINPSLMRQYKSGNIYISAKKMKEIEAGINNLGKYLASAKFVR
jgi:DNA-binding transcriptional regulator YdaS (Cro superfamily)